MLKTRIIMVTLLAVVLLIIGACVPTQISALPSTSVPTASTSEDVEWLATIITSEAGSFYGKGKRIKCTDEERAAVGWTVLNRFKSGTFGQTIKEVVTAPGQYAYKQEPTSETRELAKKLLDGQVSDATGGATHFFSPISMPKDGESTTGFDISGGLHTVTGIDSMVYFPSWAKTMTYTGDLKNVRQAYFMFYRAGTPTLAKTTPTAPASTPGDNRGGGILPVTVSGLDALPALTVDITGKVLTTSTLTSADKKVTLTINQGTTILDAQGKALSTLSSTLVTAPSAPPSGKSIVFAYDFGPNGATFAPAITLTLSYAGASLPAGTNENDLVIAWYDGAKWVTLSGTVNTATKTITVKIDHFTQFALISTVPTTTTTPVTPPVTPTPSTPIPSWVL